MDSNDVKVEKLKRKVEKDFPEFSNAMSGLCEEELKTNLQIYAKHCEDTKLAKSQDTELNNAKEVVKELAGPYNDTLRALNLKLAYINLKLNGQ